jgi:Ca2+-binding RTX toxin-like protein
LTTHGELRYSESDAPSTAWAYYPSTAAAGGDAWFNNSKNWYDAPSKGNYAWLTMLHETGHALGLKHPHEVKGSFGALPTDRDSLEYTVMSYRSYIGASTTSGYTNGSTSYPQTLMMLDIASLQKMYGPNYTTNAGDTVYRWNPLTGEMSINSVAQGAPAGNKIFMTIWDGGGNDTYDLSNYSGSVSIDLDPGGWTTASATQLASLGSGKVAVGNIANALLFEGNVASLIEKAIGGAGNDTILGNSVDNSLTGGKGNDTLDGRGGVDTANFSGLTSDYLRVQNMDGSWTVTDMRIGADGTDTLKNIEYAKFGDGTVQLNASTQTTQLPIEPVPVNSVPVGVADSYAIAKGVKLTVSAANGVLKNDSDLDGDSLSAMLVTKPAKGTLSLQSDGSFTYTPPKQFTGTVSFTYKASDGETTSPATTVTINVGASSTLVKRGSGSEILSMDDDQVPAPMDTHKADWIALLTMSAHHFDGQPKPESGGSWSPTQLIGALHTFSDERTFGDERSPIDPAHGNADAPPIELTGLPDFLSKVFLEFHLA